MATAVSSVKPPPGAGLEGPGDRKKYFVLLYSLFAIIAPPAYALTVLLWVLSRPMYSGEMTPEQAVATAFPLLAASFISAIFGMLLLGLRKVWTVFACAVGGALPAGVYFLSGPAGQSELYAGLTLWGYPLLPMVSGGFLLLPAIMFAGIPAALREIRSAAPAGPEPARTMQKVGTLRYTGFALGMVCFWLLWGDFIWRLMEDVVPAVMPLRLRDLGGSNTTIALLQGTVGSLLTFLVCPTIGFRSDRHRGPLGRRIPYLLWSAPFLTLFLILLGCSGSIGEFLTGPFGRLFGSDVSQAAVTIGVIAVVLVGFQFSNAFVNTIYWYLFNDVVPKQFMARFLSLFRIVTQAANAVWNLFIFPHSLDYFPYVFIGAGILYLVGFTLMCIMVKEGSYPPPPVGVDLSTSVALGHRRGPLGWLIDKTLALLLKFYGTRRVVNGMATFAKECFTHRFYWYFFLFNALFTISGSVGMFGVLRDRDALGLNLGQLGNIRFARDVVAMVLLYPAGWLADKFNPVRVFVVLSIAHLIVPLTNIPFMIWDFGPEGNYYFLFFLSIVLMPIGIVQSCAEIPMYMQLLPKERYGQFCSANAMLKSLGAIAGSLLAGPYMDLMSWIYGKSWGLRMYPIWIIVLQIVSLVFLLMLYRQWKVLGGAKGYVPPKA